MDEDKLKTAILGLNEGGQLLLKAAYEIDYFTIVAIADKDTQLTEKLAAQYNLQAYDDYRQLIMQNQLDCLFVAAPIHSCAEHIRTAMKKKVNVLKLAPAARNFEEAAELVKLGEEENAKFAIANLGRYSQSFIAMHKLLQQGGVEQVTLITAFCNAGNQIKPVWYTDPKLAGGGMLLQNCYEIIDQLMWNFPLPQQVYSLNISQALDKQQRLYVTEDTAIVIMRFSDTLIGNLIALQYSPTESKDEFIKIYGNNKIVTASRNEFIINNSDKQGDERLQYDDNVYFSMTNLLDNFALSILSPDNNKLCSSGRENLKNMAVIESSYLSARTGFPEEPSRILQMASD